MLHDLCEIEILKDKHFGGKDIIDICYVIGSFFMIIMCTILLLVDIAIINDTIIFNDLKSYLYIIK
jgi:hypothetical protein